ncbi:hypothetical protein WAI453_009511 [Rhynchosporium graminicola]
MTPNDDNLVAVSLVDWKDNSSDRRIEVAYVRLASLQLDPTMIEAPTLRQCNEPESATPPSHKPLPSLRKQGKPPETERNASLPREKDAALVTLTHRDV